MRRDPEAAKLLWTLVDNAIHRHPEEVSPEMALRMGIMAAQLLHYHCGLEGIPGYWMNETTGVLRPVVEKFLRGERLSGNEVPAMRAYFRQWVTAGAFKDVGNLRARVDGLHTHEDVEAWLREAEALGCDPL